MFDGFSHTVCNTPTRCFGLGHRSQLVIDPRNLPHHAPNVIACGPQLINSAAEMHTTCYKSMLVEHLTLVHVCEIPPRLRAHADKMDASSHFSNEAIVKEVKLIGTCNCGITCGHGRTELASLCRVSVSDGLQGALHNMNQNQHVV